MKEMWLFSQICWLLTISELWSQQGWLSSTTTPGYPSIPQCFSTIHFSVLAFISYSLQTKLGGELYVFSLGKPNNSPMFSSLTPPFSSHSCFRSIFLLDYLLEGAWPSQQQFLPTVQDVHPRHANDAGCHAGKPLRVRCAWVHCV